MQSLTRASANREEVVDQFGRGFDEVRLLRHSFSDFNIVP
jgi:hypothetical protein